MRTSTLCIALVTLTLAAGCGISEEVYQRDVNDLKRQLAEADEAGKQAKADHEAAMSAAEKKAAEEQARLSEERQRCLEALEQAGKEKGALSGDLRKAVEQLDAARALAARQRSTIDGIVASLRNMVSAGKLKVVRRDGRLIVEISESILFASGKSALKAEGKEAIAELSPLLAQVGREFQVTGHTDNLGTDAFNWKLSNDRALSVVRHMIESGYPADKISSAGFGPYHPVSENESPEGRALNRRVEIVLVPNLDDLKVPAG